MCDGLGIAGLGALAYFDRLDRYEECQAAVSAACSELARDEVYEFLFMAAPLRLPKATGSPMTPLAIV